MLFLNLKLGDIESVDPRSAKMQALRGYPSFGFGAGTLKVSRFRDREMPPKTPKPQARQASGEADEDLSRDSSIVLESAIDGNQCHKEICEALLPETTGWENFFLREISEIRTLSATQREKLNKIAERYEQEKVSRRICRHCQGIAQIIDEFSYYCRNCGNCLNLQWGGEK